MLPSSPIVMWDPNQLPALVSKASLRVYWGWVWLKTEAKLVAGDEIHLLGQMEPVHSQDPGKQEEPHTFMNWPEVW